MPIFIRKNPNPQTLLAKAYAEYPPDGYEASTEEAAAAWEAEQIAAGWVPAPLPEPEPVPAPRFATWLAFIRHAEAKVPGIELRVTTAALQSAPILAWFLRATGQGEMHMDHPDTIAGFAALVQGGVITQAERDALFSP